jgi:hypothetical protein
LAPLPTTRPTYSADPKNATADSYTVSGTHSQRRRGEGDKQADTDEGLGLAARSIAESRSWSMYTTVLTQPRTHWGQAGRIARRTAEVISAINMALTTSMAIWASI